ncbi:MULTISPECIES: hypothetical protein [Paenibacillus]|uniref:Uncharacterized protein n=1 Tax=Paenibacillus campinasensis TaxID=66347 RepID=A0A268EMR5_9BACL|nr:MULTISPECIES: hypothetical protein [Paenibacillus]PAD74410.1 hypothetical protein CHH67_17840 [Paenibacillus campinasensis]PAK50807.1 hypothetical protein CHH75_16380 [Paenibacillus sp. 7541]
MTKTHYFYIGYGLLCLLGITSPLLNPWEGATTVWDRLYLKFYGVSPYGGFSLLSFLFYSIIYTGFLYQFQLFLTDYLSGRFYYTAIRYQSLARWFIHLGWQMSYKAACFLVVLATVTVLIGLALGDSPELTVSVLSNLTVIQLLIQFLLNGWLQLMNGLMIVFITAWVFKEPSYNLIAMGLLTIAALPVLNAGGWLPAGLNSTAYLSGQWEDLILITMKLVVYLLIQLVVIAVLFKRKNIAFY